MWGFLKANGRGFAPGHFPLASLLAVASIWRRLGTVALRLRGEPLGENAADPATTGCDLPPSRRASGFSKTSGSIRAPMDIFAMNAVYN